VRVSSSKLIRQLIRDEYGQDIVEYVLLTAFFGLCAMLAWTNLREALGITYRGTTTGVQDLWAPPPPSGS
jgi:Flp pilus assembly pilin Flp